MSLPSNGQRRYGHVPPVQYPPPGRQDPYYSSHVLHRQSSFHNGDDAAFFNPNGHGYQDDAPLASVRSPISSREEVFLKSTTAAQSPRSPGLEPYVNTSPVLSGYQHQYQPFPAANHSPPISQVLYNPQNFASEQVNLQESQHHPQQRYSPGTITHQPYNPALYQPSHPSAGRVRHATISEHNQHIQTAYNPSPVQQAQQSPIYSQQNRVQYSASIAQSAQHEHDDHRSPGVNSVPDPGYESYLPQPDLQPHLFHEKEKNYSANRISTLVESHSIRPNGLGFQRHPTLKPLPSAPVEQGGEDDWGLPETYAGNSLQEKLFADIGDALEADLRHARPPGLDQHTGDLLDSEFEDLQRYDSRRPTTGDSSGSGRPTSLRSVDSINYETRYDDFDDDNESDLEAVAGVEAMQIAEAQDHGGPGALSFGMYDYHRAAPHYHRDGSSDNDSDYAMDLGLAGGGYDAKMSYGDDIAGTTSNSSEVEDQSRPLPKPEDLGRSDSHARTSSSAGLGGMTDYSIPGIGDIHPFPNFQPARVDTFGTGGLQKPQLHRLSFDEGDEQVSLNCRLFDSRISGRFRNRSSSRDEMPELFYHPGMGPSPYNKPQTSERPLPAVPSLSENRTPELFPAETYRNSNRGHAHSSSASAISVPYLPIRPDAYGSQQNILIAGGQHVPRSTSLSSHSSTPHTVPPVRSKTDAEERQARQKAARMGMRPASGLDGYDIGSPQSSLAIDLPALPTGRRKKFSHARLSTADYLKCKEPWALSSISSWIREMAGGDSGEGEPDLRHKAIEDGLVALFTHKVPTMNTADAETLSQRAVNSMFDAGILLPEEEWVKFGKGEISGVLWQLTGSGCYSPKVHVKEIHGRCYSHHCTRTLKKVNLQTHILEPSRKTEDWITFFKLTKDQLESTNKKEIQRQNNLHEIVMSEDLYMEQINVLRVLYRDELASWQPPIIAKHKLPKFIESVFGKVQAIKAVNENYLLAQLKYRQKEQGPWIIGFSDIFREWIRKARTAYVDYAAGFPYATYLVRREADRNLLFRQFLEQARENKLSGRLDWNTYLKAPITRLQRYSLLLGTVLHNMTQDTEEKANLVVAIEEIKAVTLECDAKVDEQSKKVTMIELQSKLYLRPGMERVELNLDHLGRELIFQGDLQRAGANRFTWLETHAILFDHYLVLAKTVTKADSVIGRKREVYDVSKLPIPMQLLVLESTNDDPVMKSSVKGIGAVTTVTKTASGSTGNSSLSRTATNGIERSNTLELTNSNQSATNDGDTRSMYPFRVKHLGKAEVYTLYAPSSQNRQAWCDKILEAKTRHAASLYEQNAEPFRLLVMADSAFAYDLQSTPQKSIVSVKGTPLDRAIRDMETKYGAGPGPGPVCRAQVNCATAFNCYGKAMIAIGTDYGVYTSEETDPRGWTRSIQISRVTQIAVLEEFSLCLIIADKSLIAYHLDVVVSIFNFPPSSHESTRRAPQKLSGNRDVSFFATARMKERTLVFYKKREGLHSTFKVLEPVFQKASEKKSRLFGKLRGGITEFFREFDEFYIPTECFTINIFHTYIAISTLKGFELMTLDKKVPVSIPDTRNPAISSIAARIAGQRPLGMFRLSDTEFLLCYEECGVYVDKHGDVSRSVIMEFVGKAKSAAMFGAYLLLFDSDFVEVRNAENGRLRQVIAGKDIRCLDYGINPLGVGSATSHMLWGSGEKRTLKLAMTHPEIFGSQIVLKMVLNEGHFE